MSPRAIALSWGCTHRSMSNMLPTSEVEWINTNSEKSAMYQKPASSQSSLHEPWFASVALPFMHRQSVNYKRARESWLNTSHGLDMDLCRECDPTAEMWFLPVDYICLDKLIQRLQKTIEQGLQLYKTVVASILCTEENYFATITRYS